MSKAQEREPLLPVTIIPDTPTSSLSNTNHQKPNRHIKTITVFLILAFLFFNIHEIIIPRRIQNALLRTDGVEIDSVYISGFNHEGVWVFVNGTRRNEKAPLKVILQETMIDVVYLPEGEGEYTLDDSLFSYFGVGLKIWNTDDDEKRGVRVGSFPLPEQVTLQGEISSPLRFETLIKIDAGVRSLLDAVSRGGVGEGGVRIQSIPGIEIDHFATYKIPMWTYFSLSTLSTLFIE